MYATPITNLLKIDAIQGKNEILVVKLEGDHSQMYDAYRHLPVAVEFDGKRYQKTGWNSDECEAYYKQRGLFAQII